MSPRNPLPELTITASGKATLRRTRWPGVGEMMTVETSGTMAPNDRQHGRSFGTTPKRIDFINRLTRS